MPDCLSFYIDGRWVEPAAHQTLPVINPATEAACGEVALGGQADVDRAVAAARRAFPAFSQTSRDERLALLDAIIAAYQARAEDLAVAITEEMGAPPALSKRAQVPAGLGRLAGLRDALADFAFEEERGRTLVVKEAVGVCGLITPWNWPLNQIACKVGAAIAAGCTMVLKPSELAPFSARIFAEVMDAAGVPAGVFNLIHGDGPGVGAMLAGHPGIDMISFTGSTRAGVEVARNAAPTVKRVHQELGGKSPNIILDDERLAAGVARGVAHVMNNTGQSCNAPTRMLVPAVRMEEAAAAARAAAEEIKVGEGMGPVVSQVQWDKVQRLIGEGVAEGATLVTGGPGRPEGLDRGYYVKPTVFARVTNGMTIAREEIFGPVLSILAYDDLDEAVQIANDTPYGLAAYVTGADLEAARALTRRLRAGQVSINGGSDLAAPFGGYGMSGNGRESGEYGLADFLEVKAVISPK